MTLPPLPEIHAGWQWLNTATYRAALPAQAIRADWNQLFTADQLKAYGAACAAAERDCRTCRHYGPNSGECMSVVLCRGGDCYSRVGVCQLWGPAHD